MNLTGNNRALTGTNQTALWVTRILGAIVLLAIGGIHLFLLLVFDGVGGVLGVLFVLQAIVVLAIATRVVLRAPRRA